MSKPYYDSCYFDRFITKDESNGKSGSFDTIKNRVEHCFRRGVIGVKNTTNVSLSTQDGAVSFIASILTNDPKRSIPNFLKTHVTGIPRV